ncbi:MULTISPECIES: metabolite traffic protein EboE [Rhodomicrobium]|uniref:metabolite traffic protein EboE n=1 Tax=Rhodomicrobium TaxID=1068 RepID=UPI0014824E99|nr:MULTISPECIES: metabolite traffic protein EboE [Rhodomicrobium]
MLLADGALLTYCTNIHPGESWPEVFASLKQHLPAVKAAVSPDKPFGVGLRLSAEAAEGLRAPAAMAAFRDFLAAKDLYVFTINGFPYGAFHGQRVKEAVYQPDWRDERRLEYSNLLADLLEQLLPASGFGTVSTVPGTFKTLGEGAETQMADRMLRHAAHLIGLAERTGKTIALALEPEPCCFLETIEESVWFFEDHLFSPAAVARVAELTGLSATATASALRRHLGLCYDVCHAAVEFENPAASILALRSAGIPIHKLQLSAALRLAPKLRQFQALQAYAEGTYLHQVVTRDAGGGLTRYEDLPDALAAAATSPAEEWRVHFHVPIFEADITPLATTQDFLMHILALHREEAIAPHLEVETYTWDVLPPALRSLPLDQAIARELQWVMARLR